MFVRRLHLRNFRNYSLLDLHLYQGANLLFGDNAQGKTNALEGIVLACTGRSPRAHADSEIVQWNQEQALARVALATRQRGDLEIELALRASAQHESTPGRRRIKVNGVVKPRQTDLIGLAPVVEFLVDDLEIIKADPSVRRRFLNTELCSLSRSYYWHFVRYQRVLEQRNRFLKEGPQGAGDPAQGDSWDHQLVDFGSHLIHKRGEFLRRLASRAGEIFPQITGQQAQLVIRYLPALGAKEGDLSERSEIARALAEGLRQRQAEEQERGMTLLGPHRDEVAFLLDGVDLRVFGSQGEQRSAAIAVRVALASVVEEALGEPPVLLLDDVLSELDLPHRAALLRALPGVEQCLITSADPEAVLREFLGPARVFSVRGGQVTPIAQEGPR